MSAIFKTQGGGGGFFPSIFVTGLSETDTVSASKDGKTVQGEWVTKTEYVTQALIPTMTSNTTPSGVASSSYEASGQPAWYAFDGDLNTYAYGYPVDLPWYAQYQFAETVTFDAFEYKVSTGTGSASTVYHKVSISMDGVTWEDIWSSSITTDSADNEAYLSVSLDREYTANYIRWTDTSRSPSLNASGSLYALQVFGKVPVVAQGFEIKPLKSYGTWTVTATDGINTKTQDVLIDVATEYEIEIDLYKLWLYREGDECEDITGGWVTTGYSYNGQSFNSPTKEATAIYFNLPTTSNYTQGLGTANTIDFTGYNKLCFECMRTNGRYHPSLLAYTTKVIPPEAPTSMPNRATSAYNNTVATGEIDISGENGFFYVAAEADAGSPANETRRSYVYNIWLE